MKNLSIRYLLVIGVLSVVFSVVAFAQDDIDDIETDMESTIAESEAAQSAASAAKNREVEEREGLKKAKSDAVTSMAKAKTEEAAASSQLRELEAKIAKSRAEKLRHEKLKAAAEKKIIIFQAKVAAKKSDSEAAEAANQATKSEKEAQEKILSGLVDEQRTIEKKIVADREDTKKLSLEIADLKKKSVVKEKELVRLRENARREAVHRDKAKADRDAAKRKVSSVPTKVVMKSPKMDCEVTDAASDGALTIGSIKKGTKYELYRIVDRRWVELLAGKKRGFAPKTCF